MTRYSYLLFAATLVCLLSLSTLARTQAPHLSIKQDAPKTYTVIKGDTLWDISSFYLDSPWLWPRLWQVNPSIENPHLIYPGDKLNLVWRNGQPMLSLKPMVQLRPKVRKEPKKAISTVREELVLPYLQSDRLIEADELKMAERVVGASNGSRYLTGTNQLYISGQHTISHQHIDSRWGIYREMSTFDVDDKKVVALKKVAEGKISSVHDDLSALKITTQHQEIMAGDVALNDLDRDSALISTTFYPQPAPTEGVVEILGSLEGSQYVGLHGVVIVSAGNEQGLVQGSMYELYQAGATSAIEKNQFQLPSSLVGHLMIIRPYSQYSLALVTQAVAPVGVGLELRTPLETVDK
ncbi:LysM peptidoglycan-binding domain-containing protein [Vibrio astriarenae]